MRGDIAACACLVVFVETLGLIAIDLPGVR